MPANYAIINAITAVTETTTSSPIDCRGARRVSVLGTRANHSAGSTTFTVLGSLDGTTYFALPNLVQLLANTNAQTVTRAASVALASNTSTWFSLDMDFLTLHSIKVVATEATDGTHTAVVRVEYED